ncbi:MAG: hypothetical protein A3J74_08565 [Elusimicrobia bacterium RIFCSPHIGHO2_02_FULL_57_9]|nr:MAG: hypothetical protein A3J74_08565 [Elusimicrobia bacterium RIFCSPHIGHO2_02_FULL_57_9]
MSRPSRNIDRRLLETARAMLPETGILGLKVREVARRAGVNLGMFHYHFRSKDAFVRGLLQEIYEDFFARLHLETSGSGSPLDRLSRALLIVGRFARDNRNLFIVLLREALSGDRGTMEFAKRNIPRHVGIILGLYEECRRAGLVKPLAAPVAVSFLMGGIFGPNCVVSMLERAGARRPFGLSMKELSNLFLSDGAVEARMGLLMGALKAGGGKRP